MHRALLELWSDWTARSPSNGERHRGLGTPGPAAVTSDGKRSLTWREFLRQAREYLPSARSPHLVPFLAVRAERIYEGPSQFFIHPDECIDCGACEPVCAVKAIFVEDETPEQWKSSIELNRQFFVDNPGVQACTIRN